ncbi:hypothetical protein Btru_001880 [Bulinus truncatus]|nr:hypothetical protein Btru_001880 [Bulinus truncatus]
MDVVQSARFLTVIFTVSISVQSATVKPPVCGDVPRPTKPCYTCTCRSNIWKCLPKECMTLQCVDGVKKKGDCCLSCPNGLNCNIEGTVVPVGQILTLPDGRQCQCEEHSNKFPPPFICVDPPEPPEEDIEE